MGVVFRFGLGDERDSEGSILQADLGRKTSSVDDKYDCEICLTYLLFGGRNQDEALWLSDAEHERLDLELRATEHDRGEVDSEYSSKLAESRIHISGSKERLKCESSHAFLVMISA